MIVTHIDSEPLATGTHKGTDGAANLFDPDAYFGMCGVRAGLAIYKTAISGNVYMRDQQGNIMYDQDGNAVETQTINSDENGLVVSATDDTVVSSTITAWYYGDTYSIYKTGTKNSTISTIGTDKSRGWKVTSKDELDKSGWFPEDHDIDKDDYGNRVPRREEPWSPGFPERNY